MELNYQQNDGKLTIFLPETIDTSNASDVEVAILKTLNGKQVVSLSLDAVNTQYVSSVGLRLVLKLSRTYKDFAVINCSSEVYDTFDITGFTKILNIQKALREISIAGCPLIGKGAYGRVYRIGDDLVLKSFFRGNPISDIERERSLAREAFILGIPTAISFDVVKVKEECYGAVYELINSDSLLACFKKRPEDYEKYLNLYADLLKKLRQTKTDSDQFPYLTKDLEYRLGKIQMVCDPEFYEAIAKRIRTIKDEDTLVHGDCHFKNIFVTDDGLLMIDMDTLSRGNPIMEMANLYRSYVCFEVIDPGNIEAFMGVSADFCKKVYEDLFEKLYGNEPDKKAIQDRISFLAYFLLLSHYAGQTEKYAKEAEKTEEIIRSLLPCVDSY